MTAVESQVATAAPTHLQAAAPFLLTAVAILVAAALALFVTARAQKEYEGILGEYEKKLNETKSFVADTPNVEKRDRTTRIKPDYLADMGNWLIDSGGMIVGVIGPAIGLALLYERFGAALIVVYSFVVLLGFAGFALFVSRVPPSGYPGQPLLEWPHRGRGPRLRIGKVWIFTPVVILTAGANLIAGIAVLIAGP